MKWKKRADKCGVLLLSAKRAAPAGRVMQPPARARCAMSRCVVTRWVVRRKMTARTLACVRGAAALYFFSFFFSALSDFCGVG
jgi:hypothetical protein